MLGLDLDFVVDSLDVHPVWHGLGSGAVVAALLTLLRMAVEVAVRRSEHHHQRQERRRRDHRDADVRLERVLHERLVDVDRRLQRCLLEMEAERDRCAALERDYALLKQTHEHVREQFGLLQTEHALLVGQHRMLLAQQHQLAPPGTCER